jgi:nucleoside-diphosphate-sugar epimerase
MNRLLIVGFGNIAKRALAPLAEHFSVSALVRPERMAEAPAFPAAQFAAGDLDDPASLAHLARSFSHIVHLAPPAIRGTADPRTAHLLAALAVDRLPAQRLVYISTSGVYGDCGGKWVDEQRPVNPLSDRARRRVDAERSILAFGSTHDVRTVILRVPGIYAADRVPLERLRKGTPVLRAEDDVYTNHIHAEDLVQIVVTALTHADAEGVYNACDDSALKMGEWLDLLADRAGLPRPPRIARAEAAQSIPAPLLSFMSESRRLVNKRIKEQLGVRLRYPTVFDGIAMPVTPLGQ